MADRSDRSGCFSTLILALFIVGIVFCYKNKEKLYPELLSFYDRNVGEFVKNPDNTILDRAQSKEGVSQNNWNIEAKRTIVNLGLTLNGDNNEAILFAGLKCQTLAAKIQEHDGSNNLIPTLKLAGRLAAFYSQLMSLERELRTAGAFNYDAANAVQKVWGEFTIKEIDVDKTDPGWCRCWWENHGIVLVRTNTGTNFVGSTFKWPFFAGVKIDQNRQSEPCLYQNGEEARISLSYARQFALCGLWPEETNGVLEIIADQSSDAWSGIVSHFGVNGKVDLSNVPVSPAGFEALRRAIRLTVGSLLKGI